MIEVGKTYKLKKIRGLQDDYKDDEEYRILHIFPSKNKKLGDIAVYDNHGTEYVAPVDGFIDPENPKEYSDWEIVLEKLDRVIKNNKSKTWRDIKECEGSAGAVSGTTASSLGSAPTPAVGQVQNTTVNGIPVFGKSVKRKRNKRSKNENVQWLPDGPESTFHDADDKEIEFEDAINLIRYGQTEDELDEYKEYLALFKRHNCEKEYLEYGYKKYGLSLFDLSPNAFGLREEAIMEKPLFLKFKHATKAFEEGKISFEEYDNILNEYRDVFNKLVFGVDKSYYESLNNKKYKNKRINEKHKKFIIRSNRNVDRFTRLKKKVPYALINENLKDIKINELSAKNFWKSQNTEAIVLQMNKYCEETNTKIDKNEGNIIYCTQNNEVISFLQFINQENKAYFIYFVIVREDFRGKNLFEKMFTYLKKLAQKNKIPFLSSRVDKTNTSSNKAHQKLGFKINWNNANSNGYVYKVTELNERKQKFTITPKKKIILDDMEDETGLNIEETLTNTNVNINLYHKGKNSLKELTEELNQILEAINSNGIIGIDETIINWLDDMGFENSNSKEGFLYYNDNGNYEHIFFYNKDTNNPRIRYEVKDNNESVYSNTWFITPSISIKDILNEITNIFNRFE